MFIRAWYEVKHFLRWSNRFIAGVIAGWLLNNLPTGVPPGIHKPCLE